MTQENETARLLIQSKSMAAGVLLALFFGPLGLFYSTLVGGVIMLVVTGVIAVFTLGVGLLVVPLICVIWAVVAVNSHNENLMRGA